MGKNKRSILDSIKKSKRKEMIRQIKVFFKFVDTFFFIEGLPDSAYKEIKKELKKFVEDVKDGKHLDRYLNEENIKEIAYASPEFVEEMLDENYEDYL